MKDFRAATISELLDYIRSSDSQVLIGAAQELASRKEASAAPSMLEILRSTNNAAVRNALALALSDLKDPFTFDVLVSLLTDPRTRGRRGTLLYALGAYEYSSTLPLLVDLVIDGNFEESRQAHSLITGLEAELDPRIWQRSLDRLRAAAAVATEERLPLLEQLISLFEQSN